MQAIIDYVIANWAQILLILVTVDQVLIGIFPQVPFFGSLKGILQKLGGSTTP